ncbi:hypothetical protein CDD81_6775 [Ophiocordyceps australis]|uniref:Ubiquitin-like 1-activating enzyme E1A n=1 Tax=Ophiocordyceps australis TaxID=1399860 RepID=A0A2C5Y4U5_9HYPO|nr:hypothetical protein CDD81_6775 [Ophiocordyceps australis]
MTPPSHEPADDEVDVHGSSSNSGMADQEAAMMASHMAVEQPAAVTGADTLMAAMAANGGGPVPMQPVSADEVALYDRQIRLWGMAAQAKIQKANILIITMRALANEVAKNLVLAGIGSLTLLDDAVASEADLGAQFLLADVADVVGQKRAQAASVALQKLNPRVRIHVDADSVANKRPSYFAAFDVVIATDLDPDSFNIINTATRLNNKAFYAAGTHGLYGFIFLDLIEHDYVIERQASNVPARPGTQETRTRSVIDIKTRRDGPHTNESVTKRELYSTWFLASDLAVLPDEYAKSRRRLRAVSPVLSCLRALWEFKQLCGPAATPSTRQDLKLFTQLATQKHKRLGLPSETLSSAFLRSFLQNLGGEIAPVAAIVGGQLAQDVINVLGQSQQPIQNMVVFDGDRLEAAMYPLHPEGSLGSSLLSLGSANLCDPEALAAQNALLDSLAAPLVLPDPTAMGSGLPLAMPSHLGLGVPFAPDAPAPCAPDHHGSEQQPHAS